MATAKGRKIAEYAESKIGCAYIWGGYGEKLCSPSFREERAGAYPSQKKNIYNNCPVLSGKQSACTGCKYNGKQAYDCAQLTRYACKAGGQELVSGANGQWTKIEWEKNGTIDTMPDVPGVLLYVRGKNGEMNHTGVYVGNGYAVEARNAKHGVVKTKVKDRTWTHWAVLPGVLSDDGWQPSTTSEKSKESTSKPQKTTSGTAVTSMKILRYGDKGTQVKVLQWLLNQNGYNAGTVDGVFGEKTRSALRSYQKAKGLEVDGICGKNSWTKLLA